MLLLLVLFLPALGAVLIALFKHLPPRAVKLTAAAFTLLPLVFAISIFISFDNFDTTEAGLKLVTQESWFQLTNDYSIQFFVGVDGLSMPLVLLTSFLGFLAVLISWKIDVRPREFFAWLLVLQTSIVGVFCAQDLFLFFMFWEIEIVPMYFLISIWGSGRKDYSAMKYVIYTLFGSAMMLAGILVLFFATGTMDMTELPDAVYSAALPAAVTFFILLIGFAIKLPLFPLHTWLPDAHTDAPTAVSVMLAGALLKMGGYGIIRLCINIFPNEAQDYAWILATLAVISIVYGAGVVFLQRDLKRLIAYSSVSHMGYVMLGVCAFSSMSVTGAALQMVSHGLITGLLFAMVGLAYGKTHTRHIPDLGGLARQMPIICVVFSFAGLASLGLPATSGFAAEVMTFLGCYASDVITNIRLFTIIGALGVVVTAGYILWMIERVFYREPKEQWDGVGDADVLESASIFTLVAAILAVGIYPAMMINMMEPAIARILNLPIP